MPDFLRNEPRLLANAFAEYENQYEHFGLLKESFQKNLYAAWKFGYIQGRQIERSEIKTEIERRPSLIELT